MKPDRMAIFVLNQTMNQVENKRLIRYVAPLPDQEIRVKVNAQVRDVTAFTGQPVSTLRISHVTGLTSSAL